MVSPRKTSKVALNNSSKQHFNSYSGNDATRIPIKNSTDWERPDFEEIDICMEVTAYIYHWQ